MLPDEDIRRILREVADAEDRAAWLAQHPEDRDTLQAFLRELDKHVEDEGPG